MKWLGILRLGLVQAALASIVVVVTSTLNRVMVVEYSLPAFLPGILVALHYIVQLARPRFGFESDAAARRTPWIVGGMAVLASGGVLCALSAVWISSHWLAGLLFAALSYAVVGLGAGAAGTSLLVLLARQVDADRRAAAATLMWILMIAGFAVTSTAVGHVLDPFSAHRLIGTTAAVGSIALVVTALALIGLERGPEGSRGVALNSRSSRAFTRVLALVWAEPESRRFMLFVFISMLAYSAQELLLEPFAGLVAGYSLGESARLSGSWHAAALLGMIVTGVLCTGRRASSLKAWTFGGCLASGLALLNLACSGVAVGHWPLRPSVMALGVANGVFAVAAIASMMEHAQGTHGHAGMRMGLWGAAQAIAFAVGGVLATSIVDATRHWFGSPAVAFAAVFTCEAFLFFLAARFAMRTAHRGARGSMVRAEVRAL